MPKVFNDHVLVEIKKSEWSTADTQGDQEDPSAGSGVVAAIPQLDDIMFFSSYSWILEASPFNSDMAGAMHRKMIELMGKKVYFEKRADIGNTIEEDGKTYATIKLSKIIAVEGE